MTCLPTIIGSATINMLDTYLKTSPPNQSANLKPLYSVIIQVIEFKSAQGRNRTGTTGKGQRILSPQL
jgi:hypothetical protein